MSNVQESGQLLKLSALQDEDLCTFVDVDEHTYLFDYSAAAGLDLRIEKYEGYSVFFAGDKCQCIMSLDPDTIAGVLEDREIPYVTVGSDTKWPEVRKDEERDRSILKIAKKATVKGVVIAIPSSSLSGVFPDSRWLRESKWVYRPLVATGAIDWHRVEEHTTCLLDPMSATDFEQAKNKLEVTFAVRTALSPKALEKIAYSQQQVRVLYLDYCYSPSTVHVPTLRKWPIEELRISSDAKEGEPGMLDLEFEDDVEESGKIKKVHLVGSSDKRITVSAEELCTLLNCCESLGLYNLDIESTPDAVFEIGDNQLEWLHCHNLQFTGERARELSKKLLASASRVRISGSFDDGIVKCLKDGSYPGIREFVMAPCLTEQDAPDASELFSWVSKSMPELRRLSFYAAFGYTKAAERPIGERWRSEST
ncbi:MAG: hypothetical protein U5N86_00390 [Planctomycetota bacterium]|nr:hypothetical protein [Planctomycetota bacterium]